MFSGGLLSRNIASNRNRLKSKLEAKKKRAKARKSVLVNWSDKPGEENKANERPSYMLEVPGQIRLVSVGGGMVVAGTLIVVASLLCTWILRSVFYGPIGIGIGIFTDLVSITWILEERNSSTKIFHIQDIYTQYATSKSAEDATKSNHATKSSEPSPTKSSLIQPVESDTEYDNYSRSEENETLIEQTNNLHTVSGKV